jgi:acetate kinase
MNTLVLRPGRQDLEYAFFRGGAARPAFEGRAEDCRGEDGSRVALARIASEVPEPDAVAVRALYGGERFQNPAIVTDVVLADLEALVPQAPLPLAGLPPLLRECQERFPSASQVLVCETAFFAALPPREYLYAVDAELPTFQRVRRYGYHGILHEAACRETLRRHRAEGLADTPRILSVCLEPTPEVAAVCGLSPVMVTSGATPLEGLPGQTSCGELDPSIVIALATEHGWGAEQINTALTQESGLKGLAGRAVNLEQVYADKSRETRLARDVFQYRLLLSCGAAVAAMGGLDAIVFSGRYVSLGESVHGWLRSQPLLRSLALAKPPAVRYYQRSVSRVMADTANAVLMAVELKATARPRRALGTDPMIDAKTAPLPGACGGTCSSGCL